MSRTNADRIRNMTDGELAEFLIDVNDSCYMPCKVIDEKCRYYNDDSKGCKDCFKEWLEREVEE